MTLAPDGVPVVIGSGMSSPNAIAVDDAVYVTTVDGVDRLPKLP